MIKTLSKINNSLCYNSDLLHYQPMQNTEKYAEKNPIVCVHGVLYKAQFTLLVTAFFC